MIKQPLLTKEELEEGAFLLLSSSTINRFTQVAKQLAMRSKLKQTIVTNPTMILELVAYGREQWRNLAVSTQRDVPEIELAFLLCLLAETALPEVDELLSGVGLSTRPSVAWLAALARELRTQRRTNTQKTIAHAGDKLGRYGLMTDWVLTPAQPYCSELTLVSSPEKASQTPLELAA